MGGCINRKRLLAKAVSCPNNISFDEIVSLVEAFGFRLSRVSGSHHIFLHSEIHEFVNLQEKQGKAKSYQIRQFLRIVEKYDLELGE